jgi:hypothetical protein
MKKGDEDSAVREAYDKYRPRFHGGRGGITGRDLANAGAGMTCAIVVTGVLHDGFGLNFSPEFYAACGQLLGIVLGRYLEYGERE